MWIDPILVVAFWIFAISPIIYFILPLGTEESTFRRLPVVTFGILTLSVVVYFLCLPATVAQNKAIKRAHDDLQKYVDDEANWQVWGDEKSKAKLIELGDIKRQSKADEEVFKTVEYRNWLKGPKAVTMRSELEQRIGRLEEANDAHVYNKYGIAGGGQWKIHQFITYAFMHGNVTILGFVFPLHLFLNMLALFAIGMSLEDLWGRSTFLVFYVLGGVVAAIPEAVSSQGVLIGASGAIAATMGAFWVRLPHTKLRIAWIVDPFLAVVYPVFLLLGKRPWGVVNVKSYYYLAWWIISQLLTSWYLSTKMGMTVGVSWKTHLTGLLFGMAFAYVLKKTRYEEKHINPNIEAKVSFTASPGVAHALELLDKGEVVLAERKLKVEFTRDPENPNTMLALIQVYQQTLDFDHLNTMSARLIRHHLAHNDKEAALYTYDSLLSAFPDDKVEPRIPIRDWLAICEFLRESNMIREAAVEYDRLVNTYPTDSMVVLACVLGGEAALQVRDNTRALRLFETAEEFGPGVGYASRVMIGLDTVRKRLEQSPKWSRTPVKPRAPADDSKLNSNR